MKIYQSTLKLFTCLMLSSCVVSKSGYSDFSYGTSKRDDDHPKLANRSQDGAYVFVNGRYFGELDAQGRPEGAGTFKYNNGNVYTGTFHNGTWDGEGQLQLPNRKITGTFSNNAPVYGQISFGSAGSSSSVHGKTYIGQISPTGEASGWGTMRYEDGRLERGSFRADYVEGLAALVSADGSRVSFGKFTDGNSNGTLLRMTDGSVMSKLMKDGNDVTQSEIDRISREAAEDVSRPIVDQANKNASQAEANLSREMSPYKDKVNYYDQPKDPECPCAEFNYVCMLYSAGTDLNLKIQHDRFCQIKHGVGLSPEQKASAIAEAKRKISEIQTRLDASRSERARELQRAESVRAQTLSEVRAKASSLIAGDAELKRNSLDAIAKMPFAANSAAEDYLFRKLYPAQAALNDCANALLKGLNTDCGSERRLLEGLLAQRSQKIPAPPTVEDNGCQVIAEDDNGPCGRNSFRVKSN